MRSINKKRYIIAGIITLLIFLLGITLGMVLDNERFRWMEKTQNKQEVDYQSLQFQYIFLNELDDLSQSCNALEVALEKSISDLGYSLEKFKEYKKNSFNNLDSSSVIERRYLLDNLKYWLFLKKSIKYCRNIDKVSILYFFSEDPNKCADCSNQGVIITHFKKIFEDRLLVFPINIDLFDKEPMINILLKTFNLKHFPSLIINDKVYQSFIDKNKLATLICSSFKVKQPECFDLID